MSAGGPLVEPSAENFILTPICAHALAIRAFVLAPDGSVTVKFNVGELNTAAATSKVTKILIFGYTASDYSDYAEEPIEFTIENGVATATVPADKYATYSAHANMAYDVYYEATVDGEAQGEQLMTIYPAETAGEPIVMPTSGEWVSYVAASYEDRTVILGILEKYAVENFLTGLTIYGNGGYVMYQDRVNPGTGDWTNYIPGYGFGVLAEGDLLG
jgi:hypothetical protein